MSDIDYTVERNAAARSLVLARLLDAATQEEQTHTEGPVGFPCFLHSLNYIRFRNDGSLTVGFLIPASHATGMYQQLAAWAGRPLIATLEEIDLDEIEL